MREKASEGREKPKQPGTTAWSTRQRRLEMSKHYYAAQSPRGFANEINVIRFADKATRDQWVEEHEDDGDCNSAACGAYVVTAKEAHKIARYKGDEITDSYNTMSDYDAE
jgi:hypothetical protein